MGRVGNNYAKRHIKARKEEVEPEHFIKENYFSFRCAVNDHFIREKLQII